MIVGTTKTAILKELRKGESYGYELARKVGISVVGIYKHLVDLEAEGLIAHESSNRRKVYRLTEKGRKLIEALSM